MIKCRVCNKDLPECEYFPSSVKRKDHICKKCHMKNSLLLQKKRRDREKVISEIKFQKNFCDIFGGWKIFYLNYAKRGEYRFQAYNTDGRSYMTNDSIEIQCALEEIFKNICK